MLKTLYNFSLVVVTILLSLSLLGWGNTYLDKVEALVYYQAMRAEHESFLRTIGWPADTAYKCILRKDK